MIFEEKDQCIDVTKFPRTFIYFLVYKGKVVYVGKTKMGMHRVYQHNDKKFDSIFIFPCSLEELDKIEGEYILKYKPKYNKVPNLKKAFSIKKVVSELNQIYGCTKCTRKQLSDIIKVLNISPSIFNNTLYLTYTDLITIENAIEDYIMGVNNNEIFNIGF